MIYFTSYSSVLLNGVLRKQLICKSGVRQGDPHSHLIFVLAADLLQSTFNEAMHNHLTKASLQINFYPDFPNIQYSDDTLMVLLARSTQLQQFKSFLLHCVVCICFRVKYKKNSHASN